MEKEWFHVCEMHDPDSPLEQKFDFTDKEWCTKCEMFEMFKPENILIAKMQDPSWPKLKSDSAEDIAKFQ